MTDRMTMVAVALLLICGNAQSQTQTLSFSLFSGDGPGNFNFDDFGAIESVTLDAGGVSVTGPPTNLAQGGAGDSAFFFDMTNAGDLFIANSNQGTAVDDSFAAIGGVSPGDVVGVAVDDANDFVFFSSRASSEIWRAPIAPDGTAGAATLFLSGASSAIFEPTALHSTSGSRLLIGDADRIFAVDPNDASTLTELTNLTAGSTRGLEEDVDNGFIYFSTDDQDDVSRLPSAGGAPTVILDGTGTGVDGNNPSFQDLALDTVNDRLILADFASDGFFDVDGRILTYPLDRSTGTLTNTPVVLLDQAGLRDPVTQNSYFTGLSLTASSSVAVPGDTDGDGDVDLVDLDNLGANFGAGPNAVGGASIGDFDGDGDVDLVDLDTLGANFGTGTSSAVPEPSTLAMVILLAAGSAARLRR